MALQKKTVRKPEKLKGCETCINRTGEFYEDTVDPNITRAYCKARHVNVDAEIMSKYCDFYGLNMEYAKPKEENRYGL